MKIQLIAHRVNLVLAALALVAGTESGCDNSRERGSRQAVRQLVEASPLNKDQAMSKVVQYGPFALVDIEQAMHGAKLHQRLRLVDAIERIGHPDAVGLLLFYEHWAEDKLLKLRAKEVRTRLTGP